MLTLENVAGFLESGSVDAVGACFKWGGNPGIVVRKWIFVDSNG